MKGNFYILLSILLTIVGALFTACTLDSGDSHNKHSRATRDNVSIKVHWGTQTEINAICHTLNVDYGGEVNGCAAVHTAEPLCEIYVTQPTSFNDGQALKILGHETWHCFGANH